MIETIKMKMEAQYNGHTIKGNGDIDLNFKMPYSELLNAVKFLQMINTNIIVKSKIGIGKPKNLGTFTFKTLIIDRDGESKIKLNSEMESVEIDNFAELAEPEQIIHIMCMAEVEEDDLGKEEEE